MNQELSAYIQAKDYLPLSLAQTHVKPLQLLLLKDNVLHLLEADLTELFRTDGSHKPSTKTKQIFPLDERLKVKDIDEGKVGLEGRLLRVIAGISTTAQYQVKISVPEPEIKVVKDVELENFIHDAEPQLEKLHSLAKSAQKSRLYVITSILHCKQFNFSVKNHKGLNINSKIALKSAQLLKGNVIEEDNHDEMLRYKSNTPITLGIKVAQLFYNKKAWWEFWKINDKEPFFSFDRYATKDKNYIVRDLDNFDFLKDTDFDTFKDSDSIAFGAE